MLEFNTQHWIVRTASIPRLFHLPGLADDGARFHFSTRGASASIDAPGLIEPSVLLTSRRMEISLLVCENDDDSSSERS